MRTLSTRTCLLAVILLSAIGCLLGFSPEASALLLTGSLSAQAPDGTGGNVFFNCEGQNPCRGTYADEEHDPHCSNLLGRADALTLNGLNLSAPGTISG